MCSHFNSDIRPALKTTRELGQHVGNSHGPSILGQKLIMCALNFRSVIDQKGLAVHPVSEGASFIVAAGDLAPRRIPQALNFAGIPRTEDIECPVAE